MTLEILNYQCCSCDTLSAPVDGPQNYIRMLPGYTWLCQKCIKGEKYTETSTFIQDLLNGKLIYTPQF